MRCRPGIYRLQAHIRWYNTREDIFWRMSWCVTRFSSPLSCYYLSWVQEDCETQVASVLYVVCAFRFLGFQNLGFFEILSASDLWWKALNYCPLRVSRFVEKEKCTYNQRLQCVKKVRIYTDKACETIGPLLYWYLEIQRCRWVETRS